MVWQDWVASDFIQTHESKVGLFFIVNSALPQGLGDSSGKITGVSSRFSGRPIFGMDRDPFCNAHSAQVLDWGTAVTSDHGTLTSCVIGAAGFCHDSYGSTHSSSGTRNGGLWRIRKRASSPTESDYSISGNDVLVGVWPDARTHLIDHAFDTHLRPGDIEYGDLILNENLEIGGNAASFIDTFFSMAGLELRFLPDLYGNVYMSAAIENSRGDADNPMMKFSSNPETTIYVNTPKTPLPDVVIGDSTVPGVASTWAKKNHTPFMKVLTSGNRDGADLAEYLNAILNDDPTAYEIDTRKTDLLLRPGDWIWADKSPIRIRKIVETRHSSRITAGKKYLDINDQWGQWRNAAGSIDHTNLVQSKEFDWGIETGSTTFTVNASDYCSEWRARLKLSWSVELVSPYGGGTVSDATCTPGGTYTGTDHMSWQIQTVQDDYLNLWKWRRLPSGAWSYPAQAGTNIPLECGITVSFSGYFPWTTGYYTPSNWYVYASEYVQNFGSPFLIVTIGGKVIPPGRIHLPDPLSGSIDIDITDYCAVGTNALTATVYNGMTHTAYPDHYQALSGSIDQYQRAGIIENA